MVLLIYAAHSKDVA